MFISNKEKKNCFKSCSPTDIQSGLCSCSNRDTSIIDKFENGKERMNTSSLLNITIHRLLNGEDPIKIIDSLIDMMETQQREILERLTIFPTQYLISKEDFDKIWTQQ